LTEGRNLRNKQSKERFLVALFLETRDPHDYDTEKQQISLLRNLDQKKGRFLFFLHKK